ncbi:hypothetical protein ACIQ7D_24210 [Streptomyces sp. NPDC096310]|uniref:hypothetical protein n=1 Tax=Streptomyces sp. NPDC096310 TaxID=3366082 RepID=UPI0037FF3DF2
MPLAALVMAGAAWALTGLLDGGCTAGPRGGCQVVDDHTVRGAVLFVLVLPCYVVMINGLSGDRWLPAWCLVAGGVADGGCTLARGATEQYVTAAAVFFALAAAALPGTWYRRTRRR